MKEIEQYRDLFINREDAYATQRRDGSYICRKKEVTDKVLVDHLKGRITCGWYCLDKGNQIKWACVDADSEDGQKLLQRVSQSLFRQHSQMMRHDFEKQWLMVDINPTGLPASRRAEGSRKGYFSGRRNRYGRQLARLSVPTYHETLCSLLYPGNQQASTMLKPSITMAQGFLGLTREMRQRTIVRSDAGLGTDGNINWLLWLNYQILMKGFSGSRSVNFAKKLGDKDWTEDPSRKRWIAWAPNPPRFGRRINVFALHWQGQNGIRHGTLLSTLFQLEPLPTLALA